VRRAVDETGLEDHFMLANPEQLLEEQLEAAVERGTERGNLESDCRIAATIIDAFDRGGPLKLYLADRREAAKNAIGNLLSLDPFNEEERVEIIRNQHAVREYVNLCHWIHGRMNDAKSAEDTIEREFGNGSEE
jgi:hypothetical protein